RDPHDPAAPAGPDPAAPRQRAGARLCFDRISEKARHAEDARRSRRASADRLRRRLPAARPGGQLAARRRRQARQGAPANPQRQQQLWHAARGYERAGTGLPPRFCHERLQQPCAGPARADRAAAGGLFRLPRGIAILKADQRLPRLSIAQSRRKPAQLKASLRQVAAVNSPAPDSIALFADEPEPIPGGDRDTAPRYWTGAILHRYRFPGLRGPETVSGTCAREEGLRTLTSPRREASLFKLGRSLVLRPIFFVVRFLCDQTPDGGATAAASIGQRQ